MDLDTSEYALEQRYEFILKPIKDIAKNFDVDLELYLDQYLRELDNVKIQINHMEESINFVQAAMIIRGSTYVYSRKVDYLYSLTMNMLDIMNNKRSVNENATGNRPSKASTIEETLNDTKFLSCDDNCNDNKNTKDGKKDEDKKEITLIIPQSLNKSKIYLFDEFRRTYKDNNLHDSIINISLNNNIQQNWYLINQKEIMPILNTSPLNLDVNHSSDNNILQDIPIPTLNLDDELAEAKTNDVALMTKEFLGHDLNADEEEHFEPMEYDDFEKVNDAYEQILNDVPIKVKVKQKVLKKLIELDPHQEDAILKPFKRGRTFNIAKHLKDYKKDSIPVIEPLTVYMANYYRTPLKGIKNNMKINMFESILSSHIQEKEKNKKHKKEILKANCQKNENQELNLKTIDQNLVDENDNSNDEVGEADITPPMLDDLDLLVLDHYGSFEKPPNPADAAMMLNGYNDMGKGDLFQHGNLFSLSSQSQLEGRKFAQSYEELVQQYIEIFTKNSHDYVILTDLGKRVQDWETKIMPKLNEEEVRKHFDIHVYCADLLERLEQLSLKDENSLPSEKKYKFVLFNDIIQDFPAYDSCRYFTAMLQLANNRNIDILQPTNEIVLNKLKIKLLSKDRHAEQINNYLAPSQSVKSSQQSAKLSQNNLKILKS